MINFGFNTIQNQVTEIPDAFRWREDTVRFHFC